MYKLDQRNIDGPIKRAVMVVDPEIEIITILEMIKRRNIVLPISCSTH